MTRLELHVLDLGRLRMPASVMIGNGSLPFPAIEEAPGSACFIDHPDGRVLFDTGCDPQAIRQNGH